MSILKIVGIAFIALGLLRLAAAAINHFRR